MEKKYCCASILLVNNARTEVNLNSIATLLKLIPHIIYCFNNLNVESRFTTIMALYGVVWRPILLGEHFSDVCNYKKKERESQMTNTFISYHCIASTCAEEPCELSRVATNVQDIGRSQVLYRASDDILKVQSGGDSNRVECAINNGNKIRMCRVEHPFCFDSLDRIAVVNNYARNRTRDIRRFRREMRDTGCR